jgi:hypothetical protein
VKIFISYRHDDSAGHAGRVHDRLVQSFGRDLLLPGSTPTKMKCASVQVNLAANRAVTLRCQRPENISGLRQINASKGNLLSVGGEYD